MIQLQQVCQRSWSSGQMEMNHLYNGRYINKLQNDVIQAQVQQRNVTRFNVKINVSFVVISSKFI